MSFKKDGTFADDQKFVDFHWTDGACPNMGSHTCPFPKACAQDPKTKKWYCCDRRDDAQSVCWKFSESGSGKGTQNCEKNGVASGKTETYTCLAETESCNRMSSPGAICWAKKDNPLDFIPVDILNETLSSMKAAEADAANYGFDPC